MATSKCGGCGSFSFEMVEKSNVRGSRFKIMFIQCSTCGVPVGVMDYFNIGNKIDELEKRVKRVEATTDNIDNNVVTLSNRIRR